jgi:hypothetical protein
MNLVQMADIIAGCIGYAISQVETSNIDILGFAEAGHNDADVKELNLFTLARVYHQLDCLTYVNPYRGISRRHLFELLGKEPDELC